MAKSSSKLPAAQYEQRVILFLDFLGFKEIVDRTVADSELLNRLFKAMNVVRTVAEEDAELLQSQQVTQFSDSIVVSYHFEEPSAVFWLLNSIALCVLDLAQRGFLVRGAVTVGKLIHTQNHLIGPAMVEAYEIESKIAKYPRVIIDPKIIGIAKRARSNQHTPKEEASYVKNFMTKDNDGRYYFDYVSWNSVVAIAGGDDTRYPQYLRGLGNLINDGLRHADIRVVEKYVWLHRQYLDAIVTVSELPTDHPYRLENPSRCEEIEGIPRLQDICAAAKSRIANGAK